MSILTASVQSTDQKMGYQGLVRSHAPLTIDYVAPYGNDTGATPMELLLVAVSACTSSGLGILLRKRQRTITRISAKASGDRAETHPTVFRSIDLAFTIESPDVTDADMDEALKQAESFLCPVFVMLGKSVEIRTSYSIVDS